MKRSKAITTMMFYCSIALGMLVSCVSDLPTPTKPDTDTSANLSVAITLSTDKPFKVGDQFTASLAVYSPKYADSLFIDFGEPGNPQNIQKVKVVVKTNSNFFQDFSITYQNPGEKKISSKVTANNSTQIKSTSPVYQKIGFDPKIKDKSILTCAKKPVADQEWFMYVVTETFTTSKDVRWYKDGVMVSNQYGDTCLFKKLDPRHEGTYYCEVKDIYGQDRSNPINLTLETKK